MKTIALILYVTLGNGQTATSNAFYYDTPQECRATVDRIMTHEYPFKLKATCHTIKPEVEDEQSSVSTGIHS